MDWRSHLVLVVVVVDGVASLLGAVEVGVVTFLGIGVVGVGGPLIVVLLRLEVVLVSVFVMRMVVFVTP